MKNNKYHFYLPIFSGKDRLACGRDCHKAGGLIGFFFKTIEIKKRCRTCQKIYESILKDMGVENEKD